VGRHPFVYVVYGDEIMTKVVAVTGAAGTLGTAVLARFRVIEAPASLSCGRYVSHNWTIHGCARHWRELGWLKIRQVNVTLEPAVTAWFSEIGHVDALVTCAGVSTVKPSTELTASEWREVIDVNLTGSFLCAREAVKRGCTRVIMIGSIHGCTSTSYPQRAAYAASKGAIRALVESLSVEWAPDGVMTAAVCPGHLPRLMPGTNSGQSLLDAAQAKTPTGHLATPEECAEVIYWLCNDAPLSMTGQTLVVDGGFTLNTYPLE
jgi:glucose 1-dehydrogenase